MALFDNGDPEKFLFFIRNFQMTLEASRILDSGVKIPYLLKLVRGEQLSQLDILSAVVGSTTSEHLNRIILDLGTYFFLIMQCKKSVMYRVMSKSSGLKVR